MHLPKGFRFSGVSCAIKTRPNTRDVSLVVLDESGVAAGVYTTNQIVAAPVVLSRSRTPSDSIRALVVNSGNANACTGTRGMNDAIAMTELVASQIGCRPEHVLIMSTGVIGRFLPMEKIRSGIVQASQVLAATETGFLDAVDGIMTTDAFRKTACLEMHCNQSDPIRIAGMAKGAGMIGPNMATLLGIIVTDAWLDPHSAQSLLKRVADHSFNCISVEGHTSTNDSLVLLCSGMASHRKPLDARDFDKFEESLTSLCIDLAKQIPDDGEGATHLIEIAITGAQSDADAHAIARNVALSNLVKTAITGGDPNWGRIVSAAGYAGVPIEPSHTHLQINGIKLFEFGEPIPFEASQVSQSIKSQKLTRIELQVGQGTGGAMHWTSDLNTEYVRFNSEYTT